MKKTLVRIYIFFLYNFLRLFYPSKYLQGRLFSRDSYTLGWRCAKRYWYYQKIRGINKHVPWPCNPTTKVTDPENVTFDQDYIDNFFNVGCYYQTRGKVTIGEKCQIAQNVGIITANHDFQNLDRHVAPKDVIIGKMCWIGMNAVILPGVVLGDYTTVGAGAVVTKSFPEGRCVIAGNPARVIKKIDIQS